MICHSRAGLLANGRNPSLTGLLFMRLGQMVCFSSIVPALPPRRQQPNRFQFLVRLFKPRNALLAFVVLHVVGKAKNIGVQELFTRHQIGEHSMTIRTSSGSSYCFLRVTLI